MQANIHDYYSDNFILIDLSKRRLRDVATVNEALDEVLPRVNKELTLAARKDEGVEEEKEAKQRDYSVIGINMAYNEIDFVMEGENRDKLIEIVIERVQRVFSEANEGVKEEDVPIREIYLSVNDIEEIPPCLTMVKNTLEKLILSRNAIKWAESSETLKSLVNLRHLELQGNLIKRIQYEDINALEKLEYLSLSCNKLETVEGMPEWPNLKFLGLFGNYLGEEYDEPNPEFV
ncbi:unnamed protein product [Moneuplotes crassus]|uniref:Uncharacterized protein n=1 Tax=Euplotes crassus TaxID=5936 RepID=A0AAD2D220_EUPCR|nr:unnamed protein product [Moneuplotes crassus]